MTRGMTTKEAIKILAGQELYYDRDKQFIADCKARRVAVRSLKAWGKVRNEITMLPHFNREEVINIIDKHLAEIENEEGTEVN